MTYNEQLNDTLRRHKNWSDSILRSLEVEFEATRLLIEQKSFLQSAMAWFMKTNGDLSDLEFVVPRNLIEDEILLENANVLDGMSLGLSVLMSPQENGDVHIKISKKYRDLYEK